MNIISNGCGGCMACCKTHSIPEINKPEGKWCFYVEWGRGCRIHESPSRPMCCQNFACSWLLGSDPVCNRPDNSGVVADYITREGVTNPERYMILPFFQIWEFKEGGLEGPFAIQETRRMFERGIAVVHIYLSGRTRLFFRKPQSLPKDTLLQLKKQGVVVEKSIA